MKKLLLCTVAMALVSLAGAQSLEAQREGFGGFLDWVHRLSGPQMFGGGVTAWRGFGDRGGRELGFREQELGPQEVSNARWRLRGSVVWRGSRHYDGAVLPSDKHINMGSLQVTAELPFSRWFAVGGGGAVHRFAGDFTDPFLHWSIPAYVQLRLDVKGKFQLVLSPGVHYFPAFDDDDFAPLATGVSTTSGEWVLGVGLGFERVWN